MSAEHPLNRFPDGWDRERVQRLIEHYDRIYLEGSEADGDCTDADPEDVGDDQTLIQIPRDLVPEVRRLIAARKSA